MGQILSPQTSAPFQTYTFLEAEKKTWINHDLQYDHPVRAANLLALDRLSSDTSLKLTFSNSSWGGISFQHWFVTNGVYFIEFGSPNLDIYTACVTISTGIRREYSLGERSFETKLTDPVRQRIQHVLGMNNYSLCLRNCEHVANYIVRGRWVSHQMDDQRSILLYHFKKFMLDHNLRMVNSFPSDIQPHVFGGTGQGKVYSFLQNNFTATQFSYYLDFNESTHNILVIGPTGAGKSHLINVMCNDAICESRVSHNSVTREIYFIRGQGRIYDVESQEFMQKNVVIADTIGLCDTEWLDADIINMIKGRVSSNIRYLDTVMIVFKADRLQPNHVRNIKRILNWLNYEKNFLRISFVSTFADYLDQAKKNELRREAEKIFGIRSTERNARPFGTEVNSMIYTGFPPEEALNPLTRSRVDESWRELNLLMTLPGTSERITLGPKFWMCAIL